MAIHVAKQEAASDGVKSAWRRQWTRAGFSLIEVLFSLAVLGLGLSMAASFLVRGQLTHLRSQIRLQKVECGLRVLTELRQARKPQELSVHFTRHSVVSRFRYRTRLVQASLPEDLRLVEVEVMDPSGPGTAITRLRGVVPGLKLTLPATSKKPGEDEGASFPGSAERSEPSGGAE